MAIVKRVLCFFYALQAIFFGAIVYLLLSPSPRIQQALARQTPGAVMVTVGIALALAVAFGGAWYTVRKGRPSARFWVIVPSLFFLLGGLGGLLGGTVSHRLHATPLFGLMSLALAIAGPLVTWHKPSRGVAAVKPLLTKVKGDGTSDLLNKAGYLFSIASYFGSLWIWDEWLRSQGIAPMRSGLLLVIGLSLVATFFHELGHAIMGIVFHMKLRAFVVGPVQWRIVEGRWTFQFNLAGLFSLGGVTGVVPTSASQPAAQEVAMIAAGPLTNLYMGILAGVLAWACTSNPAEYARYMYPLALFAIINFVDCFTNMIPLRTSTGYSDGAQIYQILANGAWAAYHRAVGLVSSSLVTPLRARDFDMTDLELASQGITEGVMAMRLRLFTYEHLLDRGKLAEAGEALKQAEAIYDASTSKEIGGMHTVFVFGHAYVNQDAAAARKWWDRMMATKRKLKNVDYWRCASALHWIEGDLAQANEDWFKADAKAAKLPRAGANEFDRTCNALLRRVLDGDRTPPEIFEPKKTTARAAAPAKPKPAAATTLVNGVPVPAAPAYQYTFMRERPTEQQRGNGPS
jgi:peptidase M50-like protein